MLIEDGVIHIDSFLAVTMGIIVLFVGRRLNQVVGFLKEFSIPEPVSGGIVFSVLFALFHMATSLEVSFDLMARDVLLVYFFTTIGINASLGDLMKGGKPLIILLVITVGYMLVQNLTGITVATAFGLEPVAGLLSGTVSLIGGHGTAIAWAPRIQEEFGLNTAMEIGIASATFGLILASIMGGPIAKFLIKRHDLKPAEDQALDVGVADDKPEPKITSYDFLDAMLGFTLVLLWVCSLTRVWNTLGFNYRYS
ncbi:sodium/glutamate symporter [Vibrio variabilis]|uniref:Sodium/glutamate symporter n=1 Tax=Vibrio variabilis TaxID=990271 RepID=A0ABQ0JQ56_9VIBR|nr:sodium/glutamate symporter [Vibrio variabilis]